jgi:hypothetical protein
LTVQEFITKIKETGFDFHDIHIHLNGDETEIMIETSYGVFLGVTGSDIDLDTLALVLIEKLQALKDEQ